MDEDTRRIIFYHWTTKAALPSIQEHGLLPRRGHHCAAIKDFTPAMVFLCREEDVTFWKNCFYDVEVLLKIDCTDIRPQLRRRQSRSAPSKAEYGSLVTISPDHFIQIDTIDRDIQELKKQYDAKYHLTSA